jgi:yecA family protein
MCDHAPDDSMGLSDLDGFLTGIVVGPELILPSEWLPVIWGGEEPVFQTEDEMRTVLGTIMGRYNEIVAGLDTDLDDFDPIFLEGPEGEVIASDWAGGFLDAVALRVDAWEPLVGHEGAGILMAPLFLLNGDMEIDDAADEDALLAQASDMIPTWGRRQHRGWTSTIETLPSTSRLAQLSVVDSTVSHRLPVKVISWVAHDVGSQGTGPHRKTARSAEAGRRAVCRHGWLQPSDRLGRCWNAGTPPGTTPEGDRSCD